MTDLRKATSWALAQGTTATAQDVADIAGCDTPTALKYLRRLVNLGVAAGVRDDFRPGPGWEQWRSAKVTTWVGSGGNSAAYLRAKAARERINARAWAERQKGVALTCTSPAATRQEPPGAAKVKNEGRRTVYMSLDAAAVVLCMSRRTIDRHVAAGHIKVVRLTCRMVRVCHDEVERFAKERETTWQSA